MRKAFLGVWAIEAKQKMDKENLELAEEHIKIAEELIEKGGLNSEGDEKKKFEKVAFELEKAEANLEDISKE